MRTFYKGLHKSGRFETIHIDVINLTHRPATQNQFSRSNKSTAPTTMSYGAVTPLGMRLTKPEDWKAWNAAFVGIARAHNVWDIVKPGSSKQPTKEPEIPVITMYTRTPSDSLLSSTRAQCASTSTLVQEKVNEKSNT
jgi:hypothetical protein